MIRDIRNDRIFLPLVGGLNPSNPALSKGANLIWDDRVRPSFTNILFVHFGPGFSPVGTIHGP
jgi:hypothetical protein